MPPGENYFDTPALDGSCHSLPEFAASLTIFDVFLVSYSDENL